MRATKANDETRHISLLSLIQDDRPLPPEQAAKAELEIKRIAAMSLLGDDALLTAAHVGVILNCSYRIVGLLRKAGKLPKTVRFGDLVRWRLSDIRAWVWFGIPPDQRPVPAPVQPVGDLPPLPDDDLLSVEHLALAFGCCVRTVEKLRRGAILPPALRQRGSLRWRLLEIRLWVRAWG
jgi:predicted DNA-binding transcriptional regulator AlpA